MPVLFRPAISADAAAVHAIYQHYVDHTAATFTTNNPPVSEYAQKIECTPFPYLVAEFESRIVGFAYADPIRHHDAYRWDVELTIYLHPDAPKRSGTGTRLYETLLAQLTQQGFCNAYGVITASNAASILFHERFGFTQAAYFKNMGYKHGAWHDVIWMHKVLNAFDDTPALPAPFQNHA